MAIYSIYTQSRDDAEARHWLLFFRRHGHRELTNLVIERVYWLEGRVDCEKLLPLFANSVYQTASSHSLLDHAAGPVIEIAYRPAVTDPETPSILAAAKALGEDGLEFARLSKRYQLTGISEREARGIAERFLFNKVVERIRDLGESVLALRPTGDPDSVEMIQLAELSSESLSKLSTAKSWYAPLSQMQVIQAHEQRIGRLHTDAEIEILVQSWSDHCYHTTWKSLGLLKKLSAATRRIAHPLVVSSFTDNAGGLEFYEDWVITIKGETHNFPSSIAPFGGVATKHGGVIRDTLGFGKGAYPIGGTTLMGTMDPAMPENEVPAGALHPQLILSESIRATAYYMNPMGIPMMHAAYKRHPGYAKCLALGHSIGLIPKKYALKDAPRPGDLLLLIGGETGRDGIHGATASSTTMTGETLQKESAAVQIGHPITERRFATAIPVLRDAGCIRSITDLGAGGISCGAGEMGAETGVMLDLDSIPLKDSSLTAWEILLSESQERMLIALPPEKLGKARSLLDRYEVGNTVLGEFTSSGRLEANWRGQKVVDLEMSFLWSACPIDPIAVAEPYRKLKSLNIQEPCTAGEWSRAVHLVLGHWHCADQSAAISQFDSTVQGRTVIGPYGGKNHHMPSGIYVSAPLHGKSYGVCMTVVWNPFYGDIDPAGMAKLMLIEAVTKAVVAGVDYHDLALCDNFYTPRVRPEVAWDLTRMVEAIVELSIKLGIPFISGKDSSSGTFESGGLSIEAPPTLAVAAFGRVADVHHIVTKDFKQPGNKILLLGRVGVHALGGSVYADAHGQRGNQLFNPLGVGDAQSIQLVWDELLRLGARGSYVAASAIGEGGLLVRLFEACHGSGLGARIDLDGLEKVAGEVTGASRLRSDELLFGEFTGAVILEVASDFDTNKNLADVPHCVIGEITKERQIVISRGGRVFWQDSVASLATVWSKAFREALE
ncbi:MAG TPA: phosphoribosylformylglycinamidine synthase subunit PurS [Terriglobia bacterium]|nr:phosphoribosylformylglycinamidine synthase subunit PurS [Terriglobia bacterium]